MKKWIFVLTVAVFFLLKVTSAFAGDLFCYTDNPSTTSHFECGTHGNCVWWAAYMRPDIAAVISGSGWNGDQWYGNLSAEGFDVGPTPKIGAIAAFSSGPVGHVAYVTSLGENGSFAVSEMDWYRSPGFTDGINYATYYPGSGNTYHRNTNPGTNVQGTWILQGFIYRRVSGGTNSYCAGINSSWGICWTPSSTDVSCQGGENWTLYNFEQGDMIRVPTNEYCLETGGTGGGTPTDPEPTDPDSDPDIHINSLDIRLIGGPYAKEIQKILYWGQSFQFEGRAQYENKSSLVAKDIDADYRITDSRSSFNENATKIDEDGLFDINPGEREENSISPITVKVSDDGTKVIYSQGSMTKSFDVVDGFSKTYIFADIEVAGDKDISSPSDHDEYGKIKLIVMEPPCRASFSATPLSGIRPLAVSFNNTSISNASDCVYSWSFGDGGTNNVYNPSHVYNNAGIFTPTLTASSYSYGYSGTKTGSVISVANPIPPSMMITNPTGNDNWRSDNTKHITWQRYNFPTQGNVRIDYTLDGGAVWRIIDSVTPNDGSRYWDMCKSYTTDSGNSYIRICSLEYGVCATSAKFYIDHAKGCK